MEQKIKLHCPSDYYFKYDFHIVRAFLYKNYSIDFHTHDFYEMNIVFRGRGIHMIENARMPVKAGDVFVIPPDTVHAYCDTENLDVYHVLLRREFVAETTEESLNVPGFLQLVEIEPFLRRNLSESMFLHLSQSRLEQLKADLDIIQDGSVYDRDELAPMKRCVTLKILYLLSYLLYEQSKSVAVTANKYETVIMRSLEYIHQHYGEKITIELLCKNSFLSRSTYLRNFEAVCNCTPAHYLNSYRAKKAVEQLSQGSVSKTEVAHSCGFYDLSHMERTLKTYGMA